MKLCSLEECWLLLTGSDQIFIGYWQKDRDAIHWAPRIPILVKCMYFCAQCVGFSLKIIGHLNIS